MNKSILSSGIFFGVVMGIVFSFMNGPLIGSISGVCAGLLFGTLFHMFVKIFVKKIRKPMLEDDTQVVYEGRANHFKGIEGVGGWLFLTPENLVFKSHSMNVQNHELMLSLNEIAEVKPAKTLGVLSNGLKLITGQKKIERFVVDGPDIWTQKINQLINK